MMSVRLLFILLALAADPFSGPLPILSAPITTRDKDENKLSILTATFHDAITTSTTLLWDVPPSLSMESQLQAQSRGNQTLTVSCEVAVLAVLKVPLSQEQHWGSGEGSLTPGLECDDCKDDNDLSPLSIRCIYMTTTGAEVWHQTVSAPLLSLLVAVL